MYQLHPQVIFHNASDQSGVLVFSGFNGQSYQYPPEFAGVLTYLAQQQCIDFDNFTQLINEFSPEQQQQVWHSLISQFILTPLRSSTR